MKSFSKKRRVRNFNSSLKEIPVFQPNYRSSHMFRFSASALTTGTTITSSNLLTMLSATKVVDTSVGALAKSVRLKSVSVWSPPSSQGSLATCSIVWTGVGTSPNIEFNDTTMSVAIPAYVKTKPPPNSLASFWLDSTSGNVFTIACSAKSVVDVQVEYIFLDGEAGTSVTVSTAAAGVVYFMPLDGSADNFQPIGGTTTT